MYELERVQVFFFIVWFQLGSSCGKMSGYLQDTLFNKLFAKS